MLDKLQKVEVLQNILISSATGGSVDEDEYQTLRIELINDQTVARLLPRFVTTCRDLTQFWTHIKSKFKDYQSRREYIWREFSPLIEKLETQSKSPADDSVTTLLQNFDGDKVHDIWTRMLDRREQDPEGAITLARTLLETVCKYILDDLGKSYDDSDDLPKLYHLTASSLNLAPEQHTEQIFKQILGGCKSVVDGLGSMRNKLGDAHGKGKKPAKPAPRHAELAVNLAGTMATFLIRTWENNKS